jgi:hypothetical protein
MLFDVPADRFDRFHLRITARSFGPAPQAGTISGFLGFVGSAEERDVFASRPSRWTRGPAIDASGRDREHELAIFIRIASQYRLPLLILILARSRHYCRLRQIEYRIGCHSEIELRDGNRNGLSEDCGQSKIRGIFD